ncbi:7-carboxy-7-deazaguanine synthase QueE [Virgibacillus ihumii]|uniref:7-carboxy-7-deazaguanine synthase QueE n=1 Tax=Virgibacillus ihumii TaxID=2686091 RepID=UPI00157CA6BF|nr:7-carboxy-7-deazaguanine synthase QueE [Virgibacillus ihumii]
MKLPILEIFGPTIQGEGMVIGQKTMFVRTAGCDYSCSWCDSKFTWDGSEKENIKLMEPEEVWEELNRQAGGRFAHVTISGGNPALLSALGDFVDLLHENRVTIALETQGSKWQPWFTDIDELTLSPKPPSSGMKTNFFVLDDMITSLQEEQKGTCSLKIVIFDLADLEYAKRVHLRYPNVPIFLQVGNDDTGNADDDQLLRRLVNRYDWLVDQVMDSHELRNVRVLPQLHTYLWGNKRGV